MGIIVGILVSGIALVLAFILVAFIAMDIKVAGRYAKATRVQGVIYENVGIQEVASYGRNQYRKYGIYQVKYNSIVGERIQEVLLKNTKLQPGDVVEVRYVIGENGVELIDNTAGRRLIELLISTIIVAAIIVLVICFKP